MVLQENDPKKMNILFFTFEKFSQRSSVLWNMVGN